MTDIKDPLDTRWALWYHSSRNNNWGKDSYAILSIVGTVRSFCAIKSAFTGPSPTIPMAADGSDMLFWMRESTQPVKRLIYPNWEDTHNSRGCSVCFANNGVSSELFWRLASYAIGETLLDTKANWRYPVNGVSVSMKKGGACVVKIWLSEDVAMSSEVCLQRPGQFVARFFTPHAFEQIKHTKPYCVRNKASRTKDALQSGARFRSECTVQRRLERAELAKKYHRGKRRKTGTRRHETGRGKSRHHKSGRRQTHKLSRPIRVRGRHLSWDNIVPIAGTRDPIGSTCPTSSVRVE